jgi:hypothetical protein
MWQGNPNRYQEHIILSTGKSLIIEQWCTILHSF